MLKTVQRLTGGADGIGLRAVRRNAARYFFPILTQVGDAQFLAAPYIPVFGSAMRGRIRGWVVRECLGRSRSQGLANLGGTSRTIFDMPVGDRSSSGRRHLPIHARLHGMPASAWMFRRLGIIHAGPGSLMRTSGEGRTQGPDPFAAATADKRQQMNAIQEIRLDAREPCAPIESLAHPQRTRPCRDAGNYAMSVPGACISGISGGRTDPRWRGGPCGVRYTREQSVSCGAFRAARSRLLRFWITRDSCRYRAQYCHRS